MKHINIRQERILYELADLQYLTISQIERLTNQAKRTVNNHISSLVNTTRPLVNRVDYMNHGKWGRNESIYFLSPRGVKALENHGLEREKIKAPIGQVLNWKSTYFHKVWMVDFFVSLKTWAESQNHNIEYFSYDFQQNLGSNKNNKGGQTLSDNKVEIEKDGIGYIVPDGIFLVRRDEKKPIFGLFEQHNGKDTGKLLRQIHAHCIAIKNGIPSQRNNVTHEGKLVANRVFLSFENEGCMKATMYRMARSQDFEDLIKFFVFKLTSDVKTTNFCEKWIYANGQQADFF
jgi:hypothetical protein